MHKILKNIIYRLRTVNRPVVYVICGPTASGKTGFSLDLAKELGTQGKQCEIISADSRQIYAEIPVFSAAIGKHEMQHIPHHLVGTEPLGQTRTAFWFRDAALKLIHGITTQNKIPIVVGGSGFWIQSLLFADTSAPVAENSDLRRTLELCSTKELQEKLRMLDYKRFANIDIDNRRRLIRSIEIADELGHVPVMNFKPFAQYRFQVIYIEPDKQVTRMRIDKSVRGRVSQGMFDEMKHITEKYTHAVTEELGLAFRVFGDYQNQSISKDSCIEQIVVEENRYAKRQRTFFRKMITRLPYRVVHLQTTANVDITNLLT